MSFLRRRATPERILILLPNCLQKSGCPQDVTDDIVNCRACGGCRVGDLLGLHRETSIPTAIVKGGRQAAELLRQSPSTIVLAVACEKELAEGIAATLFSKSVYAVMNAQPNGPCRNTTVDMQQLHQILDKVLIKPEQSTG